jgi:type VI secretion system secreted protein VgrG
MVKDVLKELLTGIDVTWNLRSQYEPHNLIVQYDETDFDFASRLMEEEGIYYFFEHADGSHKMVISDEPGSHPAIQGPSSIVYDLGKSTAPDPHRVFQWEKSQEIRPTKFTVRDHSFELTEKELTASKPVMDSVAAGTVTHKLKPTGTSNLEIVEYRGGYAHRFDGVETSASDLEKNFSIEQQIAGLRIEQESVNVLTIFGAADCPYFSAGHKFKLKNHPHADGEYCLLSVEHDVVASGDYRSGSGGSVDYANRFTCIPAAQAYRPPRTTPRPVIHGLQSAIVTGPPGEEIYVDKYGRIRIQFHWDLKGKKNEKSTCWVRLGSSGAGQSWGAYAWPRIGHEVLVAFMDGDPDQPVIVGSVYNDKNMPPYTLPDNKTRSGIKTRSSLKGTDQNFNELRFEDKKGSEEIYVHAERDMNRVVENNDTVKIGFSDKDKGDQKTEIFNNQTYRVGAEQCDDGSQEVYVWNNQYIGVGAGDGKQADGTQTTVIWNNQEISIGAGKGQASSGSQIVSIWQDRTVTLQTGNDNLTLEKGNRTATISMGNESLNIKMGNQTTKLDLGASSTEAMQAIELKVGQSSIKIDQMGVTIKGMMIKIEGQVQTSVKGLMTQVNGDAMLMVKGGLAMIN